MVHEAYTSQKCCRCHRQLKSVFTNKVDNATGTSKRVEVHGVKKCEHCRYAHNDSALQYWHRDINAAWNILNIYLALGRGEARPSPFQSYHVNTNASNAGGE